MDSESGKSFAEVLAEVSAEELAFQRRVMASQLYGEPLSPEDEEKFHRMREE